MRRSSSAALAGVDDVRQVVDRAGQRGQILRRDWTGPGEGQQSREQGARQDAHADGAWSPVHDADHQAFQPSTNDQSCSVAARYSDIRRTR